MRLFYIFSISYSFLLSFSNSGLDEGGAKEIHLDTPKEAGIHSQLYIIGFSRTQLYLYRHPFGNAFLSSFAPGIP